MNHSSAVQVFETLRSIIYSGQKLEWETILQKQYSKIIYPGDIVIDIGAHLGLHAKKFSELTSPTGSVYAIEPLEYISQCLTDEVKKHKNVNVLRRAISNYTGKVDFIVARGTPEESGLKQKGHYMFPEKANLDKEEVTVDTIDNLFKDLDKINYIKMDIEGGELDALKGAINTIQKHKPVISFECGEAGYGVYGYTKFDIFNFAVEQNLVLTDLFGNYLDKQAWDKVCDGGVYWDFFLIPYAKFETVSKLLGNN